MWKRKRLKNNRFHIPGFGVIFETGVFFGAKPGFYYVTKYQYYTITEIFKVYAMAFKFHQAA